MAIQLAVSTRNAKLDAIETEIGTAPILTIFDDSAAEPANCAAADTAAPLASFALPSDWMAAAASGAKAKSGTWSGTASASGNAAYFRIFDSGGTVCHMQGTITATGGGGDMTIGSIVITSGDTVVVGTFTLTEANS